MNIEKLTVNTSAAIPLMAALPYSIAVDEPQDATMFYDPSTQLTRFAGRNFSTCRNEESAGGLFQSKSDTSKDD